MPPYRGVGLVVNTRFRFVGRLWHVRLLDAAATSPTPPSLTASRRRISYRPRHPPRDRRSGWAYRTRTGESVRALSDWNSATTSPEVGASRAAETLHRVPAAPLPRARASALDCRRSKVTARRRQISTPVMPALRAASTASGKWRSPMRSRSRYRGRSTVSSAQCDSATSAIEPKPRVPCETRLRHGPKGSGRPIHIARPRRKRQDVPPRDRTGWAHRTRPSEFIGKLIGFE
jgi:hypothetical protein